MTEAMEPDRSLRTSPRPSGFLMTRACWFLLLACAVLILGIAIGSYKLGRYASDREIEASKTATLQLQTLTTENTNQKAKLAKLQAMLTSVQAALDATMLPQNTYEITPNQSVIVAGHLTVGLIGSPTNESINININGKHQSAAAGDIINFGLDPSMACRVIVKSFGIFKAVVIATCAEVKP